jgi:hypothetical protein
MSDPLMYDLLEQLERMAAALENIGESMKPPAWEGPPALQPEGKPQQDEPPHLSLFLESLPTWQYNSLRRKLLPAGLAAKILGLSPARLAMLAKHGFIKGQGRRYDVMSLLMWLDSGCNPDTEASKAKFG